MKFLSSDAMRWIVGGVAIWIVAICFILAVLRSGAQADELERRIWLRRYDRERRGGRTR